jgi:hypothetical protein
VFSDISGLIDQAWKLLENVDINDLVRPVVALLVSIIAAMRDEVVEFYKLSNQGKAISTLETGCDIYTSATENNPTISDSDRAKVLAYSFVIAIIFIYGVQPQLDPILESHLVSPLFEYFDIEPYNSTNAGFNQLRTVAFDLGNGIRTLTKIGADYDYPKDEQGNVLSSYSARYVVSIDNSARESGIVNQKVNIELRDRRGEASEGFIRMNIETFSDENLVPEDRARAVLDSANRAKDNDNVRKIYSIDRLNGEKITIYQLYSPNKNYFNNKADLFSFMPDDRTIVTAICTPVTKTRKLIDTLQIR